MLLCPKYLSFAYYRYCQHKLRQEEADRHRFDYIVVEIDFYVCIYFYVDY